MLERMGDLYTKMMKNEGQEAAAGASAGLVAALAALVDGGEGRGGGPS